MTPAQLLAYLGPAALIAAAALAAVAAGVRLAGGRLDGRVALTLGLALFFLTLTQYPLPDRAALDCTGGGAEAILRPFATLDHVARLWRQGAAQGHAAGLWLGSKVIQAAAMNFALCAAIGAALARHAPAPRAALVLGAGLSLSAETAQLTGLFGLYPCAFRHFEVDDLILNIGGVAAGHAAMRRLRRG